MAKTSLPTGIATLAAAGGAAIAVTAGAQPRPAGGTVTYWMSAETTSGLMASGANPAARRSVMNMLGGRGGGGDSHVRTPRLDLGSPRRPVPSLPLVTVPSLLV